MNSSLLPVVTQRRVFDQGPGVAGRVAGEGWGGLLGKCVTHPCQSTLTSQPNFLSFLKKFFFFLLLLFLVPLWRHMEVSRLEVELELQLLAYATATATQDLSCVCNLQHSSQQCQIPDPMSEARDCILMDNRFVSTAPQREFHFFFLIEV